MGRVNIYLHKSIEDYADFLSRLFDTSRSEIIETMIRHIKENDLESDIWEDYEDLMQDLGEEAEEYAESLEEEAEEEE